MGWKMLFEDFQDGCFNAWSSLISKWKDLSYFESQEGIKPR